MATSDTLSTYNAKRDFKRTPEPRGTAARKGGNSFVVQKHAARRLHFDFRLEVDGVLKSWAVTRGPSPDPQDKRLAVRTEDHPLTYGGFEGIIPQGEYGGGTVMLWDRGTWHPVPGKSAKDLEKGHLHFVLEGERMKGEWLLVRMKPRPGEKGENWLLRKVDDEFAGGADDLVRQKLTSVETGRTMQEISSDPQGEHSLKGKKGAKFQQTMKAAADHSRAVAARQAKRRANARPPAFRQPQLATLVDHVPTGNDWFHEIKFDGYRCLVAAAGRKVTIYTRSGQDWTEKFGPLCKAIAELDLPPCLIDGEITAPGKNGNPSFSALQAALKRGHGEQGRLYLDFHAFDLLELDGEDLTSIGNLERKERLAALLKDVSPPLIYGDHVVGKGEALFHAICAEGGEGIISKKASAAYRGERSKNWLKVKCIQRQEFVIIGWQASDKRRGFRSLHLAARQGRKLTYAGKVGTGFNTRLIEELSERMRPLAVDDPAVEIPRAARRGSHWIEPKLVGEIAFTEFTSDGVLRHPSFIALREDKPAKEVVREKAEHLPRSAKKAEEPTAESFGIKISNPNRVIFPGEKLTKGDLADYYAAIEALMLVDTARRPISLVRCPQGRAKQCFFQKHDNGSMGEHVKQVPVKEKDGSVEDYLYVEDARGILACVQMGTIEFHGWGSRVKPLEKPDRLVFDLDPDVGLDFGKVKKAAVRLQALLADLGLVTFPMLTGGKGIHVIAPLDASVTWPRVKDFAERFSRAVAEAEPDVFTANIRKNQRKGRIFLDWLRNQRGATAVMPYSARAREGAPVAALIAWEELDDFKGGNAFSIRDADKLLQRAGSKLLAGWGEAQQKLPNT